HSSGVIGSGWRTLSATNVRKLASSPVVSARRNARACASAGESAWVAAGAGWATTGDAPPVSTASATPMAKANRRAMELPPVQLGRGQSLVIRPALQGGAPLRHP